MLRELVWYDRTFPQAVAKDWGKKVFPDDPVVKSNLKHTLTFATVRVS
jgi:hypothetical protein